MELARIKYSGATRTDTFLAVVLGSVDGKMLVLKSQMLSHGDIVTIRKSKDALKGADVVTVVNWCKKNIPSYKHAFRSLSSERSEIIEKYE